MSDLVERLRSAILARRALAEAATKGEWTPDDGRIVKDHDVFDEIASWVFQDADRAHIIAHQPSTVIRHCDADLAILEEHAPGPSGQPCDDGHIGWCDGCAQVCKTCPADPYDLADAYPCRTVRLLAEAYGITEDQT